MRRIQIHIQIRAPPRTRVPMRSEAESTGDDMKRFAVVAVATLSVLGLFAQQALADSPHFVQGPTTSVTVSGNEIDLNLSFKAAGLGNATAYATWSLDGSGSLFSRCYNRGGNKPQADNKQETVPIDADFTTAVNHGNTTFSGTVETVTSTLTCPGNQVVVIESFSATGTLSLVGSDLSAALTWTYPS